MPAADRRWPRRCREDAPGARSRARARVDSFAHGIWFIDLAPVASPDLVPELILRVLDAPRRGANPAQRQLLSYLREKTLLLVVDNCEHLLAATDLWIELLHAAPGLKVLATSRTRLNRRVEWLQPLAGLATPPLPELTEPVSTPPAASPPALSPAELEAYDATRLFLQCVRQLRPDFQPTAQDALHIAHICHQLEGMPLGIELAAAWARTLPLSALVVEIEGSLGVLKTSLDDAPPRQRSMSATFEHSWRLAAAREQSILRQLSVFRGGFTRAAAEAVAGASLVDLETLIDKSWVRLLPSGRYVLHELTRQFCAEKLADESRVAASETVAQVRQRHCAHYSAFLHAQMQRMNYHQDVIDTVMLEFGNLQAAWDWTLDQGAVQFALDMVVNLLFLAEMAGRYHFVARVYATAAAQLAPLAAQPDTDQEHARDGLRLSHSCGDQIGIAAAHLALSRVEAATGRLTLSQEHCRLSLAMGRQSGNLHLLMDSLIQLGRIELALGRPSAATTCFEEAIVAFVDLNTAHSNRVGAALLGLGWAALAAGDYATAEHFFRETLAARGCAAWEILDAHAGLAQVLARSDGEPDCRRGNCRDTHGVVGRAGEELPSLT